MKYLIIVLFLLFNSCSKSLKEVTLELEIYPVNTTYIGLYVAQEKGFFEEQGLKLNIVKSSVNLVERAVNRKKSEFGISYLGEMIAFYSNNNPKSNQIKAIAALGRSSLYGITVVGYNNITNLQQITNMTYGVWGYYANVYRLASLFSNHNVDFSSLKIVNALDPGVAPIGTLNSNAPTAVCSAENSIYTLFKTQNRPVSFIHVTNIDPERDTYSPILITHKDTLLKDKNTVNKFLRATEKGYRYAYSNREEALDILMNNSTNTNRVFLRASLDIVANNWFDKNDTWGLMSSDRVQKIINFWTSEGIAERKLMTSDMVDDIALGEVED